MTISSKIKKQARGQWHAVQARAAELYELQNSGMWNYNDCLAKAFIYVKSKGTKQTKHSQNKSN